MRANAADALLGGLTRAEFLRRHWQKKPLLVRQAVPGFRGCVSRRRLFTLASRDDVESRIVVRERGRWSTEHGPFASSHLRGLPQRGWTLLVHGVNLHCPAADALLRRFSFIAYARLDDLMVSYAAPGGGVGAHVDSYDVFLLQGEGRRRWRFGAQRDLSLRPRLPLKILARFRPTAQWTLGQGDMLYLPPDHAHEGVALDACMTCSIGFRAPSAQELATAFLDWMRDSIALTGRYADPDLAATREPARIGSAMLEQCSALLAGIRWDDRAVGRFLGCHLTEPKPHVYFQARTMLPMRFASAARRRGVRLDPRTQILYDRHNVYVNGTAIALPRDSARLRRIANERRIAGDDVRGSTLLPLLHGWYKHGYIDFD
ncbi:MAG: cupin domain-containing protein [Betaproteobacteria bacterium]